MKNVQSETEEKIPIREKITHREQTPLQYGRNEVTTFRIDFAPCAVNFLLYSVIFHIHMKFRSFHIRLEVC